MNTKTKPELPVHTNAMIDAAPEMFQACKDALSQVPIFMPNCLARNWITEKLETAIAHAEGRTL